MTRVVAGRLRLARTPCATLAIRVIRSKPENGIARTPWMPWSRIDLDRVLGHGQDDDRDAELGLVDHARRACGPLIRPWSRASTRTTSGRSSLIVGDGPAAVGQDVEQLDPRLGVEQPADVLRDLRDVLDDEQARLVSSDGIGRTIPRGSAADPTRRSRSGGDPGGRVRA